MFGCQCQKKKCITMMKSSVKRCQFVRDGVRCKSDARPVYPGRFCASHYELIQKRDAPRKKK